VPNYKSFISAANADRILTKLGELSQNSTTLISNLNQMFFHAPPDFHPAVEEIR
jgi:hypothetical protein